MSIFFTSYWFKKVLGSSAVVSADAYGYGHEACFLAVKLLNQLRVLRGFLHLGLICPGPDQRPRLRDFTNLDQVIPERITFLKTHVQSCKT